MEEKVEMNLLDEYCESIMRNIQRINRHNDIATTVEKMMYNGENNIVSKILQETKLFDDSWISTLEAYLPSIDNIIRNPKSGIRIEEDVVPIEKARNINSASVRHLASHTHNIKEIDENGFIKPSKILIHQREQEDAIYENRFLKTLINRLILFITRRYEIMERDYESFTRNIVEIKSDYDTLTSKVHCKVELDIKTVRGNEEINRKNLDLLKRVEKMKTIVTGYKNSPFISVALAKAKEILPPVMKTNIILRNPDFKNCYMLWLFIDRYTSLGYDVEQKEQNIPVEIQYQRRLLSTVMLVYMFNRQHDQAALDEYDIDLVDGKIVKRAKVRKHGDLDFELNPGENPIEDAPLSEQFLQATKRLYKGGYESLIEKGDQPTVALRKVIKQMLEIVNSVYKTMFAIPRTENDFFLQLTKIEDENDEEEIEKYRNQLKVMKAVISAKQTDLNQSKREAEKYKKKIETHLNNIKRRKIREEKERIRKERQALMEELKNLQETPIEGMTKRNLQKHEARIAEIKELLLTDKQRKQIQLREKEKLKKQKKLEAEQKKKELREEYRLKYQEMKMQDTSNLSDEELSQYQKELDATYRKSLTPKQLEKYSEKVALNKAKEKEKLALQKQKEEERIQAKLEQDRKKQEERNKMLLEKALEQQQIALQKEQERERIAQEKAKQKEQAKLQAQKEKEKAQAFAQKQKEKERLALQKQKEKEKLAEQKAKQKEKEKLAAQKQKEKEKAKLQAQKQKEKEKAKLQAQKQKEKEKAKLQAQKQKEKAKTSQQKPKKQINQNTKESPSNPIENENNQTKTSSSTEE